MRNEQTIKLYNEVIKGSKMGMRLVDDMLNRYSDEFFRYELKRIKNCYSDIYNKANDIINLKHYSVNNELKMERMAASMEVAAIEIISTDARPTEWKNAFYNADDQAKMLAEDLVRLQQAHREVYKKFLS